MMTSRLAHPVRLKKLTSALENQRGKAAKFQELQVALDKEFEELMAKVDANNTVVATSATNIDELQVQVNELEAMMQSVPPNPGSAAPTNESVLPRPG